MLADAGDNSALRRVIEDGTRGAFVDGYTAAEPECLGLIISHHYEWDLDRILDAFAYALEDANAHDEGAVVRGWMEEEDEVVVDRFPGSTGAGGD